MEINEKDFFREATVRICGSLDMETFLWESFVYIEQYIPADAVFLTHYYPETGQQVALAKATHEGSSLLDIKMAVPKKIRSFIQRPDIQTLVIERAQQHPTARPWIAAGIMAPDASLLVMRLILRGDMVGAVTFHAAESGRFSREHADLISLLREPFAIALSNSVRYLELLELKNLLAEDNRFLHSELRQTVGEEIIGADFGLKGVMEMVRQVAPLPSPVLLTGETGTGKEVIARAVHSLSSRRDGPFIKVNCGAIPESLVDSELFGHEKGAFTGALALKRGRFERAGGGTIFLDEVGELVPEVQVRLLRVLQEKEIERVGGDSPIQVDIRVIAATNRNLEEMVDAGKFRDDLYFRLKVFPIVIPPLRERKGDIPSLVHYFMQKKEHEMGITAAPSLAPGALERLINYSWPGNVRELENAVERALILSRGNALAFDEFKPQHERAMASAPQQIPLRQPERAPDSLALDAAMTSHIMQVLHHTGGRINGPGGAAELLEINPSTLRKRMRKLGIPFGRNPEK